MSEQDTFKKSTTFPIRSWKSENGKCGLEMSLIRNVDYAGYTPGNVIEIFGLDYHPDGKGADCVNSEYFKPEELMLAMEAFDERVGSTNVFTISSKQVSKFRPLDRILEKK